MTSLWYGSRYTGILAECGPRAGRPHDPDVALVCGSLPAWGARPDRLPVGGIGLTEESALLSCVGEAIERLDPAPSPTDRSVRSSFASWPLREPAVVPDRWVLYGDLQYRAPGFPFAPFTPDTECTWTCVRLAISGEAWWVPEDVVFLYPRPGARHTIGDATSTGLSCGRIGDPVLLRGLQEVIERDAITRAWWGTYELEEWSVERVFAGLGAGFTRRVVRPNLRFRFYRVRTPFAAHVTIATITGEDLEGLVFSTGSACRETRHASFQKSILEAIQGRHLARHLLATCPTAGRASKMGGTVPETFFDHVLYYCLDPAALGVTVLERAVACDRDREEEDREGLDRLVARLGPDRPVLFRNVTPPPIAQEIRDWYVLKVVVPGLQPLHGSHGLARLGGRLGTYGSFAEWMNTAPHPFA